MSNKECFLSVQEQIALWVLWGQGRGKENVIFLADYDHASVVEIFAILVGIIDDPT